LSRVFDSLVLLRMTVAKSICLVSQEAGPNVNCPVLADNPRSGESYPKVRANMSSRLAMSAYHSAVSRPLSSGAISRSNVKRSGSARQGIAAVTKPVSAYRQRLYRGNASLPYNAPESWHHPASQEELATSQRTGAMCRLVVQNPGPGYFHPVTTAEVRARIRLLPDQYTRDLEVVQLSTMTRKRRAFPCYGMQWGHAVYLYPIEESLVETYSRPPKPAQRIEAKMFGARWRESVAEEWTLHWTAEALKDFYLNNVLIHEIGHLNDTRNTSYRDRERFANWFAIEHGYRATRGASGPLGR